MLVFDDVEGPGFGMYRLKVQQYQAVNSPKRCVISEAWDKAVSVLTARLFACKAVVIAQLPRI